MKVYVLTAGHDYEGASYMAVFYKEGAANREIEKMKADSKVYFDWYETEAFDVE